LPFYIKKIGPYAYKKLAKLQSKTIFGGMENAGAIFYFENSVTSKGIEELMAHEIGPPMVWRCRERKKLLAMFG